MRLTTRLSIVLSATIVVVAILTDWVQAQGVAQAELVVPTFSVFSAGTTISVPDRGGTSLGGMRSASDTRTDFGPNFERGFASRRSAAGAGVRVWVHDFDEMERGLARSARPSDRPPQGFAARLFDYAAVPARAKGQAEARSPHDERTAVSDRDHDASDRLKHAADLFARGRAAEERGQLKVAALYYQSVVSLGQPNALEAKKRLGILESKLAQR